MMLRDLSGASGDGATPDAKASDVNTTALLSERPAPRKGGRALRNTVLLGCFIAVLAVLPTIRFFYPRERATSTVAAVSFPIAVSGPATLEALDRASLGFRASGPLTSLAVEQNDPVRTGDQLATVASADLQQQVAVSQASVEAAKRGVAQAEAERDRLAGLSVQAASDAERAESLWQRGVTSKAAFDAAESDRRSAELALTRQEAALAAAKADQQSAEAGLGLNQVLLADATLRAPFDGVVVQRLRSRGDFVTAGTPVLELADLDSIVFSARFDESLIAGVEAGQAATVTTISGDDRPISGVVLRLGRIVDSETREFTVDIRLDRLPHNWALGQRAMATIRLGTHDDALAIPAAYVVRREGEVGVWRLQNGRATWRRIELGVYGGDRVEIAAGLAEGDVVIDPEGTYRNMPVAAGDVAE